MTRLATFCLLVIWSASVAAETAYSQVERDDQRFRFSTMMRDVHGPDTGQNATNWGKKPVTIGGRKNGPVSFGWYSYLAPRAYEDARNHEDSQVFERVLSPGLALNLSGSSVALYRNGLRFDTGNSPWFFNVNFRSVNRGSKLVIQGDSERVKGKALTLEFGLSF